MVRLMQAMGAFGYRGFFERKRRFLESVFYAAKNVDTLLRMGLPIQLPELELVFRRIVDRWARPESPGASQSSLEVLVQSFSYKDGYPSDTKGHGGGFVFDCRALPNPHERTDLRELTGESDQVVDYLERSEPVQEFWENVRGIVEAHIERYLYREFTSLTVSFGCTGGQHRSVFMARKLAGHLCTRYPHVAVQLVHGKL
jgi:RNase adaptor protein for sRNA GlmZ degradation